MRASHPSTHSMTENLSVLIETSNSCGCSGVRHCLICKDKRPVVHSKKEESEAELRYPDASPDCLRKNHYMKLCHFCLVNQFVAHGSIKDCKDSRCKSLLHQESRPEEINRHTDLDLSDTDIIVITNFIQPLHEEMLVEEIYSFPWKNSQSGRRKQVSLLYTPIAKLLRGYPYSGCHAKHQFNILFQTHLPTIKITMWFSLSGATRRSMQYWWTEME